MSSIEIFNSSGLLSSNLLEEYKAGIKRISVKKGAILQRIGEPSVNSYLVLNGLLKSYTIDRKGKEHVFMFASENWVVADLDAHSEHCLSQLYIEAIEDSENRGYQ